MRKLNEIEIQSATISGGSLGEFFTTVAGGGIGAAMASKYLARQQATWLGMVAIPLTLAGGVIGGKVAHILYNIDDALTPPERRGSLLAYLVG
ncbi:MAG: hypothetical protein U1E78_02500 [Gammaproteobacteria bacterium]